MSGVSKSEQKRAYNQAYWKKNKARLTAQNKKWRLKNKKRYEKYHAEYREKNREKLRLDQEIRRIDPYFREDSNLYRQQVYYKNHSKNKKKQRDYYYRNKKAHLLRNALREKRVREATPKWADKEGILFFYIMCPPGYHVDHIYPLNGKNSCGLHILENLQYLPADENRRKGNRYNE
jgi:hypothetical protein